jgi:hypothetical protein
VRGQEAEEGEGGVEWVRRRNGAEEGESGGGERGEAAEDGGEKGRRGGDEREVGLEGAFDDGGAQGVHAGHHSPEIEWHEKRKRTAHPAPNFKKKRKNGILFLSSLVNCNHVMRASCC